MATAIDHTNIICPQGPIIAVVKKDVEYLKEGHAEVREDIKKIQENVSKINVTTAEIKLLLNGGKKPESSPGIIENKVVMWVILGLTAIIAGLLGVSLPI